MFIYYISLYTIYYYILYIIIYYRLLKNITYYILLYHGLLIRGTPPIVISSHT